MCATCSRVQRPEERVRLGVGVDRAGDVGRLLLRHSVYQLLLRQAARLVCKYYGLSSDSRSYILIYI